MNKLNSKKLNSIEDFNSLKQKFIADNDQIERILTVCTDTGGIAFGALEVYEAFCREIKKQNLDKKVKVKAAGSNGYYESGPVVVILPEKIFYSSVQINDIPEIIEKTIIGNKIIDRLLYVDAQTGRKITYEGDIPFYSGQVRNIFALSGRIEPASLSDYITHNGYKAFIKALTEMSPEDVINEVTDAGLRGRGGAGFPSGLKWKFARKSGNSEKYLICNADEGDPGAFMDRSLLEGTPHAVIEGMLIAAYAIGASKGIIYVRAEYPLADKNAREAVAQLEDIGLAGNNILGTGFSFSIDVKTGAGAFVCGEETALIASLEGRQGRPSPRPPFPTDSGFMGRPTVINNVETLANVPLIIDKGKDWYKSIGTETSKGTKIFALAGKVKNTGLVEVPMGTTLREIVEDIGGGTLKGRNFKAAQMGGPSGGCVPRQFLDLPIDYETVKEIGAIMGSGGMIILDDTTCMVDLAKYFMEFCALESCGKCPPCRIGTTRMLDILKRICAGKGEMEDLEKLENLALTVKKNALCGLGQTAPNPVLSTLRYFRNEYVEHILLKKCRASVCPEFVKAPCLHACLAGIEVPEYIALSAEGRYNEALQVIHVRNPFASVCGRVCDHPCELHCRRTEIDEPLAIRDIKRAVTDMAKKPWSLPDSWGGNNTNHKVAVIGAGPAGLTCAYFLRYFGHQVTVFESMPQAGGMLLASIPRYRLPLAQLKNDIDFIISSGVNLKLETPVKSLDSLFEEGFEAVFIATGMHESIPLNELKADNNNIIDGIEFLKDIAFNTKEMKLGKVVVIGGGNVAIDAARSARRLGSEVTIVYRRTRKEMPAYEEEIKEAIEEGIQFEFLAQPVKPVYKKDKTLEGLNCVRMELGKADMSGRKKPVEIENSEFTVSCDTIILAVGQKLSSREKWGLETTDNGTYKVDIRSLAASREGVFAGGDCARGAATVLQAISDGQRAACSIDRMFNGKGLLPEIIHFTNKRYADEETKTLPRPEPELAALNKRLSTFDEVSSTLGSKLLIQEAKRCLRCDLEEINY